MTETNDHGQPVGVEMQGWAPPPFPPPEILHGRTVTLTPLDPDAHGPALFASLAGSPDSLWTYMTFGPFEDLADFRSTLQSMVDQPDWAPYVFEVDGDPQGFASYLRIQPTDGVIEIGSITFSLRLQRTTAATEGLHLMIARVFDLGYRRCEWKCDDLNAPSRSAAVRLGFTYEGTFRQATHYKGRNRDTAWYAITDDEWPFLEDALQTWLAPGNFDDEGIQRRSLRTVREGSHRR